MGQKEFQSFLSNKASPYYISHTSNMVDANLSLDWSLVQLKNDVFTIFKTYEINLPK